jgi:thioredoxin-like negative regulator of GroEL
VDLLRVNCDDHPHLIERFAVKELPTLIVIDQHRVRKRLEGSVGRREIARLLEPWLKATAEGPE